MLLKSIQKIWQTESSWAALQQDKSKLKWICRTGRTWIACINSGATTIPPQSLHNFSRPPNTPCTISAFSQRLTLLLYPNIYAHWHISLYLITFCPGSCEHIFNYLEKKISQSKSPPKKKKTNYKWVKRLCFCLKTCGLPQYIVQWIYKLLLDSNVKKTLS